MTSINSVKGFSTPAFQGKKENVTQPEAGENKKGMSKGTKIAFGLGATALAAAGIAFVMMKGKKRVDLPALPDLSAKALPDLRNTNIKFNK